jgi:hypothetical protein
MYIEVSRISQISVWNKRPWRPIKARVLFNFLHRNNSMSDERSCEVAVT